MSVGQIAIAALTLTTAYGQVRAGRTAARGYAMQATQRRVEAQQQALQYKQQAVDVLDNILQTAAMGRARAGAGGIDPFSGSADQMFNFALSEGINELYTVQDNTVIALRAGEMEARQLLETGRAVKEQAKVQALGTLISGGAAISGMGGPKGGGGTIGPTQTTSTITQIG